MLLDRSKDPSFRKLPRDYGISPVKALPDELRTYKWTNSISSFIGIVESEKGKWTNSFSSFMSTLKSSAITAAMKK